jgi:hypothetical protein
MPRISELTAATAAALTQEIPVREGSGNRRLSVGQIRNLIAGCKPHDPTKPYTAGEVIPRNGELLEARTDLPAKAFDADDWAVLVNAAGTTGVPQWNDEEAITVPDVNNPPLRVHEGRLWMALQASTGVEPGTTGSTDFWFEVSPAYEFGRKYSPALTSIPIGGGEGPGSSVFVGKRGTVYRVPVAGGSSSGLSYGESSNNILLFEAVFPALTGQNFVSTDFGSELLAGKWRLIASNKQVSGTNYLFVPADGTPAQNGTALQAAIDLAATLEPNGDPLSATNQIWVVAAPGYYGAGNILLTAEWVNLTSLTGQPDAVIDFLELQNDNIRVVGVNAFQLTKDGASTDANVVIENCKADEFYSQSVVTAATFKNCHAVANGSFGGSNEGEFNGTLIDCSCIGAIALNAEAVSGKFIRVIGGENSLTGINTGFRGQAYYSQIEVSNWPTVSGPGLTRFCLNGDGTADDQG